MILALAAATAADEGAAAVLEVVAAYAATAIAALAAVALTMDFRCTCGATAASICDAFPAGIVLATLSLLAPTSPACSIDGASTAVGRLDA